MKAYTPYAERKETGSDQLENEASWALFTRRLLVLEIWPLMAL